MLECVSDNERGLILRISGDWTITAAPPSIEEVEAMIRKDRSFARIHFDTRALSSWDSSLLIFLTRVIALSGRSDISVHTEDLPEGVQKLLDLASERRQQKNTGRPAGRGNFFTRTADIALGAVAGVREMLSFVGEAAIAFTRLLTGRADFRSSDLFTIIEETGVRALPIVSLISVLVGLILAFVSSIQLRLFGAQIYVADIVGIGMVRVMGAVMTGIIMAGRTGAAFAAQLGTMQVNEEIDALRTLGISPMEFLVLPRIVALSLMMPLLCLYADLMGIIGGLIVGVTMLDLNFIEYYNHTTTAVTMTHFWVGIFHSAVFGVLVALSGCLRGMQGGKSASAVGSAATSAVVTGIVSIVIATAIITYSCEMLGI